MADDGIAGIGGVLGLAGTFVGCVPVGICILIGLFNISVFMTGAGLAVTPNMRNEQREEYNGFVSYWNNVDRSAFAAKNLSISTVFTNQDLTTTTTDTVFTQKGSKLIESGLSVYTPLMFTIPEIALSSIAITSSSTTAVQFTVTSTINGVTTSKLSNSIQLFQNGRPVSTICLVWNTAKTTLEPCSKIGDTKDLTEAEYDQDGSVPTTAYIPKASVNVRSNYDPMYRMSQEIDSDLDWAMGSWARILAGIILVMLSFVLCLGHIGLIILMIVVIFVVFAACGFTVGSAVLGAEA